MLRKKNAISKMMAILIAAIVIIAGVAGAVYYMISTSTTPSTEEITLHLIGWSYPDAYVKKFINEYEAANPKVTISWETGPSQEYYEKAVTLLTTSPNDVDIMFVDWGYSRSFKDAGWIYPLDNVSFINDTELNQVKNDLTADALQLFSIDGKLYGLPYFMGSYTWEYNKVALANAGYTSPPTTVQQFLDMNVHMKEMGMFENPILWPLETAPYGAHLMWEALACNIGGEGTKLFGPLPNCEALFLEPNSAGYKALELLQQTYELGLAPQGCVEQEQMAATSIAQNGNVTPWTPLISPHNFDDMNNPAVSATAGQWAYMQPIGTGWAPVRGAYFALSTNLMTNKPESYRKAAWDFMRNYLGSARWGKEMAISDGLGFGWKSLWDDPTIASTWNRWVNFTEVKAQSDRSIPITTLCSTYDATWFPEWRLGVNAFIQDCFLGHKTVEQTVNDINAYTQSLIAD